MRPSVLLEFGLKLRVLDLQLLQLGLSHGSSYVFIILHDNQIAAQLIIIQMIDRIQKRLAERHPELTNKRDIFEYYVSFEFPEKQRKLLAWWESMIEEAVRFSPHAFLSPADLELVFSVMGLKPVPLEKVLNFLSDEGKIQWEGRQKQEALKPLQNRNWIGTITNYIWNSSKNEEVKTGFKSMQFQHQEKIIPLCYKNQLLQQIRKTIVNQLQDEESISYDYIFDRLRQQIAVSGSSIEFLLAEMESSNQLTTDHVQNKRILFYTSDGRKRESRAWVEVEKSKFTLRSTLELFNRKIEARIGQQSKKLQQAKNFLEIDRGTSRRILTEVKSMRKVTEQLQIRRRLLQQTLDQLQMNELNCATIDVISQSQSILQNTLRDASELEQIKDRHLEIAFSQKETNARLEQMTVGDIGQEVDELMAQLEKEIGGKRKQDQVQQEYPQNRKEKLQVYFA